MKRILSFAALCGLLAFPAFAQTTSVPPLMNFQGRLAKPDGTPLPDGAYSVTFSLWNVASAGSVMTNQVWTETDTVTVRNGVFALLLGNTTALSDSLFAGNAWLQIQVKTDAPLSPRQRLVSVGYAFKANSANTVPDSSITSAKLAYDHFSLAKVSGNALVVNNDQLLVQNFLALTRPRTFLTGFDGQNWHWIGANPDSDLALGLRRNGVNNYDFIVHNRVGINTESPQATLDVNGGINVTSGIIQKGGAPVTSTSDLGLYSQVSGGFMRFVTNGGTFVWNSDSGGGNDATSIMFLRPNGDMGIGGEFTAKSIQVTGSDVAEPYLIAAANDVQPAPGLVVRIDPEHSGHLQVAAGEYDGAVAGIISGANGVRPGVVLRQPGTLADGNMPVASVGRVYCWCDADANGPIRSGDLLTTSNTPGHAMRVTDHARAQGAVIGKAMMPLAKGKGMILVLVTLQ